MADAEMPNNYPKVIISLYTKKANVFELTAGSPEFDGSKTVGLTRSHDP
jgi:hypothetical protein